MTKVFRTITLDLIPAGVFAPKTLYTYSTCNNPDGAEKGTHAIPLGTVESKAQARSLWDAAVAAVTAYGVSADDIGLCEEVPETAPIFRTIRELLDWPEDVLQGNVYSLEGAFYEDSLINITAISKLEAPLLSLLHKLETMEEKWPEIAQLREILNTSPHGEESV